MVELSFWPGVSVLYIRKKKELFLKKSIVSLGLGKVGLGAEGWRREHGHSGSLCACGSSFHRR